MMWLEIKASHLAGGLTLLGLFAIIPAALGLAAPQVDATAAVGLAPIHEARADALARHAAGSDLDRGRAVAETKRSLAQAPANPTPWLRLAYLDSVGAAGLTMQGDRALAASYAVAPYGPDVTRWRLTFALNHWAALSDETRRSAMEELRVATGAAVRRQLLADVSDPAGRVALVLLIDAQERAAVPRSSP